MIGSCSRYKLMVRNCYLTTWIFLRLTFRRFGRVLIFHRIRPMPFRSEGVLCLRNQPHIAARCNEFAWFGERYVVVPANNTAANFRQPAARAGTWDQYLTRVSEDKYLQLGLFVSDGLGTWQWSAWPVTAGVPRFLLTISPATKRKRFESSSSLDFPLRAK